MTPRRRGLSSADGVPVRRPGDAWGGHSTTRDGPRVGRGATARKPGSQHASSGPSGDPVDVQRSETCSAPTAATSPSPARASRRHGNPFLEVFETGRRMHARLDAGRPLADPRLRLWPAPARRTWRWRSPSFAPAGAPRAPAAASWSSSPMTGDRAEVARRRAGRGRPRHRPDAERRPSADRRAPSHGAAGHDERRRTPADRSRPDRPGGSHTAAAMVLAVGLLPLPASALAGTSLPGGAWPAAALGLVVALSCCSSPSTGSTRRTGPVGRRSWATLAYLADRSSRGRRPASGRRPPARAARPARGGLRQPDPGDGMLAARRGVARLRRHRPESTELGSLRSGRWPAAAGRRRGRDRGRPLAPARRRAGDAARRADRSGQLPAVRPSDRGAAGPGAGGTPRRSRLVLSTSTTSS